MSAQTPVVSPTPYPTIAKRAALWLVFLAPFFYLTYGFANWTASQRENVGSIVYDWERAIPFLAWTIIPYWTVNAFYAASLFINRTTQGVDRLAGRYLTAQLIAVAFFIAFPLAASFARPETSGLPGFMFDVLTGFDKPFNQAPSLHIALTVIIWDHLRRRLSGIVRLAWHIWCFLIAASVLTTFQHHFIDIPTGALLGLFALWLFPADGRIPCSGVRWTTDSKRKHLAAYYLCGGALCLLVSVAGATWQSATWLVLLWPALALAIVAFGYVGAGPKVFQKGYDGRVTLASLWLLWPYRLGARINAWAWTRKIAPAVEIADGVWLGRFPLGHEAGQYAAVIDLAAEFERPAVAPNWIAFPMLDLVTPPEADIDAAARAVEAARQNIPGGKVIVCCALGFQRSARVVARWLVVTGRTPDEVAAIARIRTCGRPVVLHDHGTVAAVDA
ncbi:MAG: phosphatase PAP2/dual specificity phosphatase family protein [Rhizobiaceae bacterium]